jgi:hypothetical protein
MKRLKNEIICKYHVLVFVSRFFCISTYRVYERSFVPDDDGLTKGLKVGGEDLRQCRVFQQILAEPVTKKWRVNVGLSDRRNGKVEVQHPGGDLVT